MGKGNKIAKGVIWSVGDIGTGKGHGRIIRIGRSTRVCRRETLIDRAARVYQTSIVMTVKILSSRHLDRGDCQMIVGGSSAVVGNHIHIDPGTNPFPLRTIDMELMLSTPSAFNRSLELRQPSLFFGAAPLVTGYKGGASRG